MNRLVYVYIGSSSKQSNTFTPENQQHAQCKIMIRDRLSICVPCYSNTSHSQDVLGLKYKFKRLPTLQDGSFDMRYTTNACIADVLYLVKYSLQYVMVYICTKRNGATQIFVTQCKLFLVQEILKMGRFWKYILVQRNDPFRFIADSSPFWEIYMPRRVRADGIITASLIQDK
ncbi:unnamed protein product [Lepeophtheirus salmonis]|uniref:(salmon louse) hypothetical protein n=1 Tax=Lepeophtheirus salmonis TaxID=72036 RepID=A0A7R8D9I4_LEPSM|nr:unnamed protein product [Lepeophtheirus salmonis]CAF3045262.1 unnamed protein product [Lepeophtheirus salmonis]